MATEKKKCLAEKTLGAPARTTIEDFVINNLGPDAEAVFEMAPGTVDVSHINSASVHWEDDGEGGTQCVLKVWFEKEGTWTAT